MKSLTIVTTYGPRYWPLPIQKSIESTLENWPDHAKILVYPDDQTQCMSHSRLEHYDLCREQPVLDEFIVRNKNNPKLQTLGQKDYEFEYDAIRFSYKVFACIDAYQKTKPDMMWYLDADIITFEKIPIMHLHHTWAGQKKDFLKQVITHLTQHINMLEIFSQDGQSITIKICILIYKKDILTTSHVLVTQTHLLLTQ